MTAKRKSEYSSDDEGASVCKKRVVERTPVAFTGRDDLLGHGQGAVKRIDFHRDGGSVAVDGVGEAVGGQVKSRGEDGFVAADSDGLSGDADEAAGEGVGSHREDNSVATNDSDGLSNDNEAAGARVDSHRENSSVAAGGGARPVNSYLRTLAPRPSRAVTIIHSRGTAFVDDGRHTLSEGSASFQWNSAIQRGAVDTTTLGNRANENFAATPNSVDTTAGNFHNPRILPRLLPRRSLGNIHDVCSRCHQLRNNCICRATPVPRGLQGQFRHAGSNVPEFVGLRDERVSLAAQQFVLDQTHPLPEDRLRFTSTPDLDLFATDTDWSFSHWFNQR